MTQHSQPPVAVPPAASPASDPPASTSATEPTVAASATLTSRLPAGCGADTPADADALFDAFGAWVADQGLTLYPAQTEALIEVVSGSNIILATPTGSGKSLVATGAHFAALGWGRRTFYTAPIKALVSEKFFALCAVFGAASVGMMTGDASVNETAPIICCTAEILANIALRDGAEADVGQVVMDEFHYYADPDRGWAWQVPLIELPNTQFLLMSATLGDVTRFEEDLTRRTGRPTAVVRSAQRPVPLFHRYVITPLHETIEELLETRQAPVYVVHFTQASALERAQSLMSINVSTRAEKDAIAQMIGGFRFASGFGKTLSRLVRHGIGVHHAGMLPKYRRLVELLAQAGLLKVICGTDTLGVGINVPIRTVVFTALSKYDGTRTRILTAREFHQIAGRAGRAGFDTVGNVVVQAPEHVVENEKALAKAGEDPKKRRKVVRRKPPEGFVSWGVPTFDRLVSAEPEPLVSQFAVSHSMLLNVISRPGDAFTAMRHLLTDNHEPRPAQRRHIHRAIAIYRALLAAGVVEKLDTPDETGRAVRLTGDLQLDFALNQPLSPFALAAIELLDRDSPGYALDVLSLLESTLDNPRQVLSAQQFRARGEAVAAMKAEGVDYDRRMELLDEVTWPKPLDELLHAALATYRRGHPWVDDYELAPKSVARDIFERAMTFAEYVDFYGLARSEGLLLRYLADAFKALRQTVPEEARTEELGDLTEWLGELVRQVDSSLLDEWEALRDPTAAPDASAGAAIALVERTTAVTANLRAFRVLVRNALFRRVELAALRRHDLLGELDAAAGFDADAWQEALERYYAEHDEIGTGPDARGPGLLLVTTAADRWTVRQIFDDPAGDHDWGISAEVDLAASDEAGTAVVRVTAVDQL
ncbi:RNA helicase [Parafrankia sp. EUN1f]|uniref:DEAD/DEAH box helicase n=1 Tax=Parafrankia sp. EUN1f TaxID=102897 RepID=UPI0001C446A4|nr:DEAD/DEAH box helicase [Parafrankia sp. EUN1f]EFC84762.1 DEAD/DEAH box helicase domain protein [Parafrankia sp. EUN1f]